MINEIIYGEIIKAYESLETNSFRTLGLPEEKMYDKPLMGVAAGDDPYYDFLKEHIGPFHWSPVEAFALKYDDVPKSSRLRVISLVFPQSELTRKMQNDATVFPCDRWVVSRGEWEPMMREFASELTGSLAELGIRCVSIDLAKEFRRENSENLGIASLWSHRHTAYAAGLGTFSLNDGFISEKGIAIRLTSFIVEAELEITPRGDRGPYDWCLFYSKGTCGACIKRCPVSAISKETGHNKAICSSYEDVAVKKYWPQHIDRRDYIFGCGLCQAKIPCQNKRP